MKRNVNNINFYNARHYVINSTFRQSLAEAFFCAKVKYKDKQTSCEGSLIYFQYQKLTF